MILLEAQSMMDTTFTVADLITIGAVVGGGIKLWYGQVQATKKLEAQKEALSTKINVIAEAHAEKIAAMEDNVSKAEQDLKNFTSDAKKSRREIRDDYKLANEKDNEILNAKIADNHKIMNERVNKLQSEVKEDRKDNKQEFASINDKLTGVATDTKAILMMLQSK